ncbi:MAG: hypothetical protein ACT4PV_14550 [Planctomycetaceae bacterium]
MARLNLFLALALVLACGCGGSGAAPAAAPVSASALEVLEDCFVGDALDLTGLLEQLDAVVAGDPAALATLLQITTINLGEASVSFTLDLDGDTAADLLGTLKFQDAAGMPTLPFDILALLGGTLDLSAALAAIPDGTRLILDWSLPAPAPASGSFRYDFVAGGVGTFSGSGNYSQGPCAFAFALDEVSLGEMSSPYPVANFTFDLSAGSDRVRGGVEMDGSALGTIRAQLGSNPEEIFTLDLDTGLLTPR